MWFVTDDPQLSQAALAFIVDPNAFVLATLPMHHKDPFDRMIVSQAIAEKIEVVGIDNAFDAYGVTRIW